MDQTKAEIGKTENKFNLKGQIEIERGKEKYGDFFEEQSEGYDEDQTAHT